MKKLISLFLCISLLDSQGLTLGYSETQNPSQSSRLNPALLSPWFEVTSQSKSFSWNGSGLILIRDLHADGEAQLKIAQGIEAMTRQTGSTLVLEEGAVGKIDTGFLGTFPNQSIREEITKEYVKSGWVRGPEFLSIAHFGELDLELRGVEDQTLYQKNFAQYREVMKHKKEVDALLGLLKEELTKAKKKFCSVEFRRFEEKSEQFQDNHIALDEYVKFLLHYSFNPSQCLHLSLFNDLMEKKRHINETSAEKEKNLLIQELSRKLDKQSLGSFIHASLEYRLGRMSIQEFNQHLGQQAQKIGKDAKDYPELYKLMEWIRLQSEMDGVKLLQEIKSLEEVNINKLAKTNQEKKLKDLTSQIQSIQNFLNLELSRQDWEKYQKDTQAYDVLKIAQELGKILEEKPVSGLSKINGILADAKKFYELARERDQVIAKNSIGSMKEVSGKKPSRLTILVVGGFHSTGVQEVLNAQGINYIELTPRMNHVPNASLYLTRMMDPRFKIGTIPLPCLFQEVAQALADTVSEDTQKKLSVLYLNALRGQLSVELKGDVTAVQKRLLDALALWKKQRGELSKEDVKVFEILESEIKSPSSIESPSSDISKEEIERWMEGKEYTELHATVLIKILETFYSERKDLIEYAKDLYQKKWGRHKVRRQIFIHQDGMAMSPILTALKKMGVLDLFKDGHSASMGEIIAKTKGSPGYLHVAMRLFVSQGWMTRKGEAGTDDLTYTLTEDGTYILSLLDYYGPVTEFMDQAVGMDDYLFGESRAPPADGQKKSYAQLIELSKNQWNLPPETDPRKKMLRERVIQQLNGMLLGPTMVALGMHRIFDEFKKNSYSMKVNQIQGNAPHLVEAFTLLEQQGWLTRNGNVFTLTHDGRSAAVLASAYGVTTSYLPLFSKLKELLGGQSREALFPRDRDGHETHVNRPMNVWGSGGAHIAYFKEADKMIIEIFNRPLEEQPRGIADMGCGDGTFLIHLYEVVMKTKRGNKIREILARINELDKNPDLIKVGGAKYQEYLAAKEEYEKYKLVIVGADFNEQARTITANNLSEEGVTDVQVIFGNINDPKKYAEDLRVLGIEAKDLLHVRSMLDHNRPYLPPKNTDHIRPDRRADSGAYVKDGMVIPNSELQQNLVEHFEGWQEHCIGNAGLLVIELHTIPPELAATKIGDTLATPYDAHHGFSDQYIAEIPTFVGAATEAGLELVEQKAFPTTTPEAATVSINYFRASSKKKIQASWAWSFGEVFAVHDGPEAIYQALRNEIAQKVGQHAGTSFDLELLEKAYRFASEKYKAIRHDGRPYVVHPLEIAFYMVRVLGIVDQDAILAAILHDLVEDENVPLDEIERMFGENVRALVDDLSEDASYVKENGKIYNAQNGQVLTGKLAMKIEHIERVDRKSGKLCIIIKIVNRLHNLLSNEYPGSTAHYQMKPLEIERWKTFLDHHASDVPSPLIEDIRYFIGRNEKSGKTEAVVSAKKSPDLTPEGAEITVTHDERNAALEKKIKDGQVVRLSLDAHNQVQVALEIHDSVIDPDREQKMKENLSSLRLLQEEVGEKFQSAKRQLERILNQRLLDSNSSLSQTCARLIQAGKITDANQFKVLLLKKASQTDLLVSRDGKLSVNSVVIHENGPYLHCRRGVSDGRSSAIWIGEEALKRISEEMLARSILDETLHAIFPDEDHYDLVKQVGTIVHDQDLYEVFNKILRLRNFDRAFYEGTQAQYGVFTALALLEETTESGRETYSEIVNQLDKVIKGFRPDHFLDRNDTAKGMNARRQFFSELKKFISKLHDMPPHLQSLIDSLSIKMPGLELAFAELSENKFLPRPEWVQLMSDFYYLTQNETALIGSLGLLNMKRQPSVVSSEEIALLKRIGEPWSDKLDRDDKNWVKEQIQSRRTFLEQARQLVRKFPDYETSEDFKLIRECMEYIEKYITEVDSAYQKWEEALVKGSLLLRPPAAFCQFDTTPLGRTDRSDGGEALGSVSTSGTANLTETEITHEARNEKLEAEITAGNVYEMSMPETSATTIEVDPVVHETQTLTPAIRSAWSNRVLFAGGLAKKHRSRFVQARRGLEKYLNEQLANPSSSLSQTCQLLIASGEISTQQEFRDRLLKQAQEMNLLVVKGKMTVHADGPYSHCRRGVSGRPAALWVGEISLQKMLPKTLMKLILDESLHAAFPNEAHRDVKTQIGNIVHDPEIFESLDQALRSHNLDNMYYLVTQKEGAFVMMLQFFKDLKVSPEDIAALKAMLDQHPSDKIPSDNPRLVHAYLKGRIDFFRKTQEIMKQLPKIHAGEETYETLQGTVSTLSQIMSDLNLAWKEWRGRKFLPRPEGSTLLSSPSEFCQFDATPLPSEKVMAEIRKAYGKQPQKWDDIIKLGEGLLSAIKAQPGMTIHDDIRGMIGKAFLDRAKRMNAQRKIPEALRDYDRAVESFLTMSRSVAVTLGTESVSAMQLIEQTAKEIVACGESYAEVDKEKRQAIPLDVNFILGRAYLWSSISMKDTGDTNKAMQQCGRAMDLLTRYASESQRPVASGGALSMGRAAPEIDNKGMLYLTQAMIENGNIQMSAGSYNAARIIFKQTLDSNKSLPAEMRSRLLGFVLLCKTFEALDENIRKFIESEDNDASSLLHTLSDLESKAGRDVNFQCAGTQISLYRWMIYAKLKDDDKAKENFQEALDRSGKFFLPAFKSLINTMGKAKVLWGKDFLQAIASTKGQPFLRKFLREIVKDYFRNIDLKEFREAVRVVLGFKNSLEYVQWLLEEEQEKATVEVTVKNTTAKKVGSTPSIDHPGLVAPLIEAIQTLPEGDEKKTLADLPSMKATPVLQAALRGEIPPIKDVVITSLELRDELLAFQEMNIEAGDKDQIREKSIAIAKKFKDMWLFTEGNLASIFWEKFFGIISEEMSPDIDEALKAGLAWIERHSQKTHEHQRSYMYYQCGQIYYMANRCTEAAPYFQKVIEQSSSLELRTRSLFSLGSIVYFEARDQEDGAEKTSKLKRAKDLVAGTLKDEALKSGALDSSVGHLMLSYICSELYEYKEAYAHLMNAKKYPGNFSYIRRKFLKSFLERLEALGSGDDLKVYKDFLSFACQQDDPELMNDLVRFRSIKNQPWIRVAMEILSNKGVQLKQRQKAVAFLKGLDLEKESAVLIGIFKEQAALFLKKQPNFLWESLDLLRTCPTDDAKAFIQEIQGNAAYAKVAGYSEEKVNAIAKARDQYEGLPQAFESSDPRAATSKYYLTRTEWNQMLLDYWPKDAATWDEYILEREASKFSDRFERLQVYEIRSEIEKAHKEDLSYDALVVRLEALNSQRIHVKDELDAFEAKLSQAQELMDKKEFPQAIELLYRALTGRGTSGEAGSEMIIAHERNRNSGVEENRIFALALKGWDLLERASYFLEEGHGEKLVERWVGKEEELKTKDPAFIVEIARAFYFLGKSNDALKTIELIPAEIFETYGYFTLWRLKLMFKTEDDRFLAEYEKVKKMTDAKAKNLLGKFCRERGLLAEGMDAFQAAYTGSDSKMTNPNENSPGAYPSAVSEAQVPIREVFQDAFLSCIDMMLGASLRNKAADFVRVHLHEYAFPEMILMGAETFYEAGCYLEALDLLTQRVNRLKEKKHLVEYHQRRGKILAALNRDDEALKAYEEAIAIDPSKFEHWRDLIGIYYEKKDYASAIRCIKKAISLGASKETSYCMEDISRRVLSDEGDAKYCLFGLLEGPPIESSWDGVTFGMRGEDRVIQFKALEEEVEKVFGVKIDFVFSGIDIKTKNIGDEIFNKINAATKIKSPYLEEVLGEGMFKAMVQEAVRADCLGEILKFLFAEAASSISVSKGKGVAKAGRKNEKLTVDGPITHTKLLDMGVKAIQRLKTQGDTSFLEKIAKGPWVAATPEFQKALKGEVVRVSAVALMPAAQGPPLPEKNPNSAAVEVSGDEDASILATLKECIQAYSSNKTLLAFQKALELAPRFKNLSNNPTQSPKDLEIFAGEVAVFVDILSKYGDIRFDNSLEEGLKTVLDWAVRAGPAFKILRVLVVWYRGKLYLKARQFAKSRAFFATALVLDPSEQKQILPDIAEAFLQEMRMSDDVDQRRKIAEEAIPVIENDSSYSSLIALGWFYAEVGNYDKVFGVIKKLNVQKMVLSKGSKDQEKVDVDLIFRSMISRCFETLQGKDFEIHRKFIQTLIGDLLESPFAEALERGKEQGALWTQALIAVLNQEMSSSEKDRLIQLLKGADFRGAEEQWLEILRQKASLSDAKKREAFFKFAIPVSARCFSFEVRDFLKTLKPGFSLSKDNTLTQAIDQAVASIQGNQAIETRISEGTCYLTLEEWRNSLRGELPSLGEWDEWMLEVETAKFVEEFSWIKARKIRDELVKAHQLKLNIEAVRSNLKVLEEEAQKQLFKDENLRRLESIEQEIHQLVENGQWDEAFGYITLAREGNVKKGFPGYYQLWRNASGAEKDRYRRKLQEIRDFAEHWFFLWKFESDLKEAVRGQRGSAIDLAYERMVKPYVDDPSKLALKAPVDLGEIATCFYVVGAKRNDKALKDKAKEIVESINLQEVLKTDSINIHRVVSAFKNILGYEKAKAILDMIDPAIIRKDERLRGLYLLVFSRLNDENAFVAEADSFERDFPGYAAHHLGQTYEARENQEKSLAYYDRAFQETQARGQREKYFREHSLWLRPSGMASLEYRIRRLRGVITDSEYHWMELIDILSLGGRYLESMRLAKEKMKSVSPKNQIELQSHIGACYENMGRREEAFTFYEAARTKSPTDVDLWARIGIFCIASFIESHPKAGEWIKYFYKEAIKTKNKSVIDAFNDIFKNNFHPLDVSPSGDIQIRLPGLEKIIKELCEKDVTIQMSLSAMSSFDVDRETGKMILPYLKEKFPNLIEAIGDETVYSSYFDLNEKSKDLLQTIESNLSEGRTNPAKAIEGFKSILASRLVKNLDFLVRSLWTRVQAGDAQAKLWLGALAQVEGVAGDFGEISIELDGEHKIIRFKKMEADSERVNGIHIDLMVRASEFKDYDPRAVLAEIEGRMHADIETRLGNSSGVTQETFDGWKNALASGSLKDAGVLVRPLWNRTKAGDAQAREWLADLVGLERARGDFGEIRIDAGTTGNVLHLTQIEAAFKAAFGVDRAFGMTEGALRHVCGIDVQTEIARYVEEQLSQGDDARARVVAGFKKALDLKLVTSTEGLLKSLWSKAKVGDEQARKRFCAVASIAQVSGTFDDISIESRDGEKFLRLDQVQTVFKGAFHEDKEFVIPVAEFATSGLDSVQVVIAQYAEEKLLQNEAREQALSMLQTALTSGVMTNSTALINSLWSKVVSGNAQAAIALGRVVETVADVDGEYGTLRVETRDGGGKVLHRKDIEDQFEQAFGERMPFVITPAELKETGLKDVRTEVTTYVQRKLLEKSDGEARIKVLAGLKTFLGLGLISVETLIESLWTGTTSGDAQARESLCDVAKMDGVAGTFGKLSIQVTGDGRKTFRFSEIEENFGSTFTSKINLSISIEEFQKTGFDAVEERMAKYILEIFKTLEQKDNDVVAGIDLGLETGLIKNAGAIMRTLLAEVKTGNDLAKKWLCNVARLDRAKGDFGEISIESDTRGKVLRFKEMQRLFRNAFEEGISFVEPIDQFEKEGLAVIQKRIVGFVEKKMTQSDEMRGKMLKGFEAAVASGLVADAGILVRSLYERVLKGENEARSFLAELATRGKILGNFGAVSIEKVGDQTVMRFWMTLGESTEFTASPGEFGQLSLLKAKEAIAQSFEADLMNEDKAVRDAGIARFKQTPIFLLLTENLVRSIWGKVMQGNASARRALCVLARDAGVRGDFEVIEILDSPALGVKLRLKDMESKFNEIVGKSATFMMDVSEFEQTGVSRIQGQIISGLERGLLSEDESIRTAAFAGFKKALALGLAADASVLAKPLWEKAAKGNAEARGYLCDLITEERLKGNFEGFSVEEGGKAIRLSAAEKELGDAFEGINLTIPIGEFRSSGLAGIQKAIAEYIIQKLDGDGNEQARAVSALKEALRTGILVDAGVVVSSLWTKVTAGDVPARAALILLLTHVEGNFKEIGIEEDQKHGKVLRLKEIEEKTAEVFGEKIDIKISIGTFPGVGLDMVQTKIKDAVVERLSKVQTPTARSKIFAQFKTAVDIGLVGSPRVLVRALLDKVIRGEVWARSALTEILDFDWIGTTFDGVTLEKREKGVILRFDKIEEQLKTVLDLKNIDLSVFKTELGARGVESIVDKVVTALRKKRQYLVDILDSDPQILGEDSRTLIRELIEDENVDDLLVNLSDFAAKKLKEQQFRFFPKGVILSVLRDKKSGETTFQELLKRDAFQGPSRLYDRGYIDLIEQDKEIVLRVKLPQGVNSIDAVNIFLEKSKAKFELFVSAYDDECDVQRRNLVYQVISADSSEVSADVKKRIGQKIEEIIAQKAAASTNGESPIEDNGLNGGAGANGANGVNGGIHHVEVVSIGTEAVIGTETVASDAKIDEGQGFSNLQKEIYNKPVKARLESGEWSGATFEFSTSSNSNISYSSSEPQASREVSGFSTGSNNKLNFQTIPHISNDSGGEDFNSAQTLSGDEQRVLKEAIGVLTEEDRAHLQGREELGGKVTIVFIDGLDEAVKAELRAKGQEVPSDCYGSHYALSRTQIYLDRSLLKDPIRLRIHLHHELAERESVIRALVSQGYPDWRNNRTDPRVIEIIRSAAAQKHDELLLEEGRKIPLDHAKVLRLVLMKRLQEQTLSLHALLLGLQTALGQGAPIIEQIASIQKSIIELKATLRLLLVLAALIENDPEDDRVFSQLCEDLAREFNVDKVLIRPWTDLRYDVCFSFGFTPEQLRDYFLNEHNGDPTGKIGIASEVLAIPPVDTFRDNKSNNINVLLARSDIGVGNHGGLDGKKVRVDAKKKLGELIAEKHAPWPTFKDRLADSDRLHFEYIMSILRHNGGIDTLSSYVLPNLLTLIGKLGEEKNRESNAAELIKIVQTLSTALSEQSIALGILEVGSDAGVQNIKPIFEKVSAEYQTIAQSHGLTLEVEIEIENACVDHCDVRFFELALRNLMDNAIKYRGEGKKIILRLKLEPKSDGKGVVVEVEDEGMGIPDAEIEHIFDAGFRASNVGEIPGTGLGLGFVRKTIEMVMRGKIVAESVKAPGASSASGTKFVITLPLVKAPVFAEVAEKQKKLHPFVQAILEKGVLGANYKTVTGDRAPVSFSQHMGEFSEHDEAALFGYFMNILPNAAGKYVMHERYEFEELLTAGTYGLLFKVKDLSTGENLALRVSYTTLQNNRPWMRALLSSRFEEQGLPAVIQSGRVRGKDEENRLFVLSEYISCDKTIFKSTLEETFGLKAIGAVFDVATGPGDWMRSIEGQSWLSPDAPITGFDLVHPTPYDTYDYHGVSLVDEQRGLKIAHSSSDEVYPQPGTVGLLHESFSEKSQFQEQNRLKEYDGLVKEGGWMIFTHHQGLVHPTVFTNWLDQQGYAYQVYVGNDIPVDYPRSFWAKHYSATVPSGSIFPSPQLYVIVAHKVSGVTQLVQRIIPQLSDVAELEGTEFIETLVERVTSILNGKYPYLDEDVQDQVIDGVLKALYQTKHPRIISENMERRLAAAYGFSYREIMDLEIHAGSSVFAQQLHILADDLSWYDDEQMQVDLLEAYLKSLLRNRKIKEDLRLDVQHPETVLLDYIKSRFLGKRDGKKIKGTALDVFLKAKGLDFLLEECSPGERSKSLRRLSDQVRKLCSEDEQDSGVISIGAFFSVRSSSAHMVFAPSQSERHVAQAA